MHLSLLHKHAFFTSYMYTPTYPGWEQDGVVSPVGLG